QIKLGKIEVGFDIGPLEREGQDASVVSTTFGASTSKREEVTSLLQGGKLADSGKDEKNDFSFHLQ
ncbi:hypothetical protein C0J52_10886, partial [Blattella germanica]